MTFVTKTVADEYNCAICQHVMSNPADIGCGNSHLFCIECIKEFMASCSDSDTTIVCPLCQKPSHNTASKLQINHFVRRLIEKLETQCPNKSVQLKLKLKQKLKQDIKIKNNKLLPFQFQTKTSSTKPAQKANNTSSNPNSNPKSNQNPKQDRYVYDIDYHCPQQQQQQQAQQSQQWMKTIAVGDEIEFNANAGADANGNNINDWRSANIQLINYHLRIVGSNGVNPCKEAGTDIEEVKDESMEEETDDIVIVSNNNNSAHTDIANANASIHASSNNSSLVTQDIWFFDDKGRHSQSIRKWAPESVNSLMEWLVKLMRDTKNTKNEFHIGGGVDTLIKCIAYAFVLKYECDDIDIHADHHHSNNRVNNEDIDCCPDPQPQPLPQPPQMTAYTETTIEINILDEDEEHRQKSSGLQRLRRRRPLLLTTQVNLNKMDIEMKAAKQPLQPLSNNDSEHDESKIEVEQSNSHHTRTNNQKKKKHEEDLIVVKNGCAWVGSYGKLKEHLKSECLFASLLCRFCNKAYLRGNEDTHEHECHRFPIPCPNDCGELVERWRLMLHRRSTCQETLVHCQIRNCREKIKRKHFLRHLANECKFQSIDCSFAKHGCKYQCARKEMGVHLQSNEMLHIQMKMNSMEQGMALRDQEIAVLKKEIASMKRRMVSFERQLSYFSSSTSAAAYVSPYPDRYFYPPAYAGVAGGSAHKHVIPKNNNNNSNSNRCGQKRNYQQMSDASAHINSNSNSNSNRNSISNNAADVDANESHNNNGNNGGEEEEDSNKKRRIMTRAMTRAASARNINHPENNSNSNSNHNNIELVEENAMPPGVVLLLD